MESGLLSIETSANHPGLIRIRAVVDGVHPASTHMESARDDAEKRMVLHFQDVYAARMHAHQALRRHLVDIDTGVYRVTLVEAIACLQAIGLRHRSEYLDPKLTEQMLSDIAKRVKSKRKHAATIDRIWQIVGGLAVAFLVLLGTTLGRG